MSDGILPGFEKRKAWAQKTGVSSRTAARYAQDPEDPLPTMNFGGFEWVHVVGAQRWLERRLERRLKKATPKRRRA